MIELILPGHVASGYLLPGTGPDPLLADEQSLVGGAVQKRVDEVTRGRHCARRALAELFPRLPAHASADWRLTAIPRGDRREPLWPAGIVGSITHCAVYAAAAVASASECRSLGIDAEPEKPLPEGVIRKIASEEEQRALSALPPEVPWGRVLFSAKEAIYKAWFPVMRRWLDFHDVVLEFDPDSNRFRTCFRDTVPRPDEPYEGRFLIRDGVIVTAVCLPPCQEP